MTATGGQCLHHPTRAADTPCLRCGTFLCDWCVKLSPSWAPGLCLDCQERKHTETPTALPQPVNFYLLSAGLGLAVQFSDLDAALRVPGEVVSALAVTLDVVLLGGLLGSILLVLLRRRLAIPWTGVLLLVMCVLDLLVLLLPEGRAIQVVLPFVVKLMWFAFFTFSPDLRAVFTKPLFEPSG